jgi:predicted secreted protein
MSYLEIFITFVVIWWLVIFLVLPFGNKWDEDGKTPQGLAKSAPQEPTLKRKAYIASGISVVLTLVAHLVMSI